MDLGTGTFSPSVGTFSAWIKTSDSKGIILGLGGRATIHVGDIIGYGTTSQRVAIQVFDGDRVSCQSSTIVSDINSIW